MNIQISDFYTSVILNLAFSTHATYRAEKPSKFLSRMSLASHAREDIAQDRWENRCVYIFPHPKVKIPLIKHPSVL